MKRNRKTEKLKAYLEIKRKLHENWEAQRALGYKPLDKPVHHGYNIEWVLRDDAARRDDADELQAILDYYATSSWCKDDRFKQWDGKNFNEINPGFKEINEHHFRDLYPWAKKYFKRTKSEYSQWGTEYFKFEVVIPSFYLVAKVTKSYNTHYKVLDEVLLQEESDLNDQLDWNYYDIDQKEGWSYNRGAPKGYRKAFHKANRANDKIALKKNLRLGEEAFELTHKVVRDYWW